VSRLITFFGMLPNFEPQPFCSTIRSAPAHDGSARRQSGLRDKTMTPVFNAFWPQYDNALARDWLMTFLLDLGVERTDGEIRFAIEDRRMPLSEAGPCGISLSIAGAPFKRQKGLLSFSPVTLFGCFFSIATRRTRFANCSVNRE